MKKVFSLFLVLFAASLFFSCSQNMAVLEEGGTIGISLNSKEARMAENGTYEETDAEEYEILIKGKTELSNKYTVDQLKEGIFYDNIRPGEYTVVVNAYGKLSNDTTGMIAHGSTKVQVFSGATAYAKVILYPMNDHSFDIRGLTIQNIEYKFNADYFVYGGNNVLQDYLSATVTYNDGTVITFDSLRKIEDLNVDTSNMFSQEGPSAKYYVGDIPVEITYGENTETPVTNEIIVPVKYEPMAPASVLSGNGSIAAFTGVQEYKLTVVPVMRNIYVYGTDEKVEENYILSIGVEKGSKDDPAVKIFETESSLETTLSKSLKLGMYLPGKYDTKYRIIGKTEIVTDERYVVPKDDGYIFHKEKDISVVDYGFDLTTTDINTKVSGALSTGAEYHLYATNYADSRIKSKENPYSEEEFSWSYNGDFIEECENVEKAINSYNPLIFKIGSAEITSLNISYELKTTIKDVNDEDYEVTVSKTKEISISQNSSLYSFAVSLEEEDASFEAKLNDSGKVEIDLGQLVFNINDAAGSNTLESSTENITYNVPTYTYSEKAYPYIGEVPVTFRYTLNGQTLSTVVTLKFVHTLEKANGMTIKVYDSNNEICEPINGIAFVNYGDEATIKAEPDTSNFTKYVYYGDSEKKLRSDEGIYTWENNYSFSDSFVKEITGLVEDTCTYTPCIDTNAAYKDYIVNPNEDGTDVLSVSASVTIKTLNSW